MSISQETSMRSAFLNMRVNRQQTKTHAFTIASMRNAVVKGSGIHKVPEWNAHLSRRTYTELKDQGVMA